MTMPNLKNPTSFGASANPLSNAWNSVKNMGSQVLNNIPGAVGTMKPVVTAMQPNQIDRAKTHYGILDCRARTRCKQVWVHLVSLISQREAWQAALQEYSALAYCLHQERDHSPCRWLAA